MKYKVPSFESQCMRNFCWEFTKKHLRKTANRERKKQEI